MSEQRMTLVEKLLNPAWSGRKGNEPAVLDTNQTLDVMKEAARVIKRLPPESESTPATARLFGPADAAQIVHEEWHRALKECGPLSTDLAEVMAAGILDRLADALALPEPTPSTVPQGAEPRPMTGLWTHLSPEQQAAALAYDGPENFGPAEPLTAGMRERVVEVLTQAADALDDCGADETVKQVRSLLTDLQAPAGREDSHAEG